MNKLKISADHYNQLVNHLFPGDGLEAVAIGLCGRSTHQDDQALLIRELMLIPYDACIERTPTLVRWPTSLIDHLTEKARRENLGIVKIHCHPGGGEFFSEYDDQSDYELFEHIFAWLEQSQPHASCVMLPGGRLFGRFFESDLTSHHIDRIAIAGPDMLNWNYDAAKPFEEEMQKRNLQAFGKGTIELLNKMKIGVVGCSGTGSPVIEQLKRYGVGELVLVDPDFTDFLNLNRIIGTTKEDAINNTLKTEVMKREISKVGFGTTVQVFASNVVNYNVVQALSQCDLLISCVDGVEGRHILNLISTFYLVPLIDMGVKLDADGKGNIEAIYGSVHFIYPGGSSLLSREQYSQEQLRAASIQRTDKEEYQRNAYLAAVDEDTPAVITVNMLIAALAVNEMLARLHPYRFISNKEADTLRFHFNELNLFTEQYPDRCPFFSKYVGHGDQPNLLNLLELSLYA